jgi:uncharacterized membrane protein YeaQ/YmgE (transglycosylase-associated protein family)
MVVTKTGEAVIMNIVLGVAGAIACGWLFDVVGHSGVTDINLYSVVVSFLGSMVVLVLYHAMHRHPGWMSANSR